MANRMKSVNGVAVEMTDAEEAARTAEELEATRPRTTAEKDAEVAKTLETHFGVGAEEDQKVRNLMAADVLRSLNPTLSKLEALAQLRSNYETHLVEVRAR